MVDVGDDGEITDVFRINHLVKDTGFTMQGTGKPSATATCLAS
jgi:hypothetical protein